MIPCPKCGERSAVTDCRLVRGLVRRRRVCQCSHKFTTLEQPVELGSGHSIERMVAAQIGHARALAKQMQAIAEWLEEMAEVADD